MDAPRDSARGKRGGVKAGQFKSGLAGWLSRAGSSRLASCSGDSPSNLGSATAAHAATGMAGLAISWFAPSGRQAALLHCSVKLVVVLLLPLLLCGEAGRARRSSAAAPRVELPRAGRHRFAALVPLCLCGRPAVGASDAAGFGRCSLAKSGFNQD